MSKSLISAKVLGGGVAGAGGIASASYGLIQYFKTEEVDISQTTPDAEVSKDVASESGIAEEQDIAKDTHTDSLTSEKTEEKRSTDAIQEVPQALPASDLSASEQVQAGSVGATVPEGETVKEKKLDTVPSNPTEQISEEPRVTVSVDSSDVQTGKEPGKSVGSEGSDSTLTQ